MLNLCERGRAFGERRLAGLGAGARAAAGHVGARVVRRDLERERAVATGTPAVDDDVPVVAPRRERAEARVRPADRAGRLDPVVCVGQLRLVGGWRAPEGGAPDRVGEAVVAALALLAGDDGLQRAVLGERNLLLRERGGDLCVAYGARP